MKAKPECCRRTGRLKLRPLHVLARASIDFDLFAGLDEERGLHRDAGFQKDRLLDVVGGISTDAFGRVGNRQHDAGGQLDRNSFVSDERDRDGAIFNQVIFDVAQDFRREGGGLVGFRIGKNEIITVFVTEIHLPRHHRDDFDLLRRAEADIRSLAGFDAAKAGLDKGAEIARSAVLRVQDNGNIAVVADSHAFA
jgi:hypothetical protein